MQRTTKAQKEAFLDRLAETGTIETACQAAGFARRTANRLRERDPAFERDCTQALKWGLEVLRDEAVGRARRAGPRRCSTRASASARCSGTPMR